MTREAITRRPAAILAAAILALAMLTGCGIPPQHLNELYDAYSQTKWYYRSAPTLSANNAYVEDATEDQVVDVYAQRGGKPAPVLIFVHGGAWSGGHARDYAALAKTFYNRGWVVFLATYRKYPEVTYPTFVDDTVAALNWCMANIEKFGGDPERVILAGHSAGAHLVSYIYVDDTFREKFAFDPMAIDGVAPLSGPFDFSYATPHLDKTCRSAMGTEENWKTAQPMHYIRGDVPPMLLMVGENDRLTPAEQVALFGERMRAAGADARYVELPKGDHYSIIIDMLEGHEGLALGHFMDFAEDVFADGSRDE